MPENRLVDAILLDYMDWFGFINAFIIPSFELLDGLTKKKLEIYLRNVKENLKMWEEKNHKNINVN